jgi:mono/diheme cytochrome c family protein
MMFTTLKYRLGPVVLLAVLFVIPQLAKAQGKADEGQKLFEKNCVTCHGADGSGNTPIGKAVGAKDLRSPEVQKLTDAQIYKQIDQGSGNMPPLADVLSKAKANDFKEKADDLTAYIRELAKKPSGVKKP